MNRSLKSSRPESSTYSTSSSTALRGGAFGDREGDDLRALACDVAGGDDPRQRQLRHEPDLDRARRRQVRAERAAEEDLRDLAGLDPEVAAEDRSSRSRSRPSRTGARARRAARGRRRRRGGRRSPRRPCRTAPRSRATKRPEWSSIPAPTSSATASTSPEPHSPDGLDVADHRQLHLAVDDLHALDRALGGAHPAADLGRLERRPGRRGAVASARAEEPSTISEFVPTSMNRRTRRSSVRPGREDAGDDVGADVRAERGEEHRRRALVDGEAEVARRRLRQLRADDRERRHRQRLGVDAERELDHRHVAGDDDLVDLGRIDARLGAHLAGQRAQRLVRVPLQPLERVVVDHRRRDARDHVRAERLLRVQDRTHRARLSGLEVEQRRDDRRRAEVEGDRVPARSRCRPARRRSGGRRRGRRSPSSRTRAACGRACARRSSGTRGSTSSIASSRRSRSER